MHGDQAGSGGREHVVVHAITDVCDLVRRVLDELADLREEGLIGQKSLLYEQVG